MKFLGVLGLMLLPLAAQAASQEVRVLNRTAYFPAGPSSVVVYQYQQGKGSYTGARRTLVKCGKRKLTAAETQAIRNKFKGQDGKFAVQKTWIITTTRKQPF